MRLANSSISEWSRDLAASHPAGQRECCRGFTIIELLVVMAMVATLVAIGAPVYGNALNKARVTKAVADIRVLEKEIEVFRLFSATLPNTLADLERENFLDPYGNPYKYLNYANAKKSNKWGGTEEGTEKPRKDRFLVPLNSEYDLYSKGKDGQSKESLTAKESWDDIVRANDGGYLGLASEY